MLYFLLFYLLIICGITAYKAFKVKSQDDFMVAGRKVSTFFLVGTLICTWIGSGSLFGGAGLAFRSGLSELWMSAGAWIGIIIVYFLVPKVHKLSQYTMSDILEKRYNRYARLFGTITIIIAYVAIAGYQFRGGGRLLNILFPSISPEWGAIYTMIFTVLFTLSAGMLSIVAMDIFNGIIMTVGILIALPILVWQMGGLNTVIDTLPSTHLTVFGEQNFGWAMGVFFPTFFLLIGESSMYQKFFSAKSEKSARNAVIGMVVGIVLIETILNLVAVTGRAIFNADPNYMSVANGVTTYNSKMTETIILNLAMYKLPLWAGGLLMSAAVAIILSTANTFLMVSSTNIAHDIYHRFINPKATGKHIILVQRFAIVGLGIISLLLLLHFSTILGMALSAYTMIGAGITPALLAALLWKRVTPAAGVASIAAGMITTILFVVFEKFVTNIFPWWDYDYIIYPAAIASIYYLVVVSYLTTDPEKKYKEFISEKK